jgi:hypothetical protein
MRRSVLSSALCALSALALVPASAQEATLRREGDRWVQTFNGSDNVPPGMRLRVNAHGPVTVVTDVASALSYSVKVAVRARNENEARRVLRGYSVRLEQQGGWITLTQPRGPAVTSMTLRAPRHLREAIISTSDGAVEVAAIDCPLRVDTGAGSIRADRVGGDCRLESGGGDIRIGAVDGLLNATTGGGPITVKSVRGEAVLETGGGDIIAGDVGGQVRATTAGGSVRIGSSGGAVIATTGGGTIAVDRAAGLVTARNAAGPVQVGSAAGVRCEAGTGAIRLSNISGSMRVSTAIGSIMANLLSGKPAESFLTTGNGDITVVIPSNLGVTIRAENEMTDTLQRIVSEFPGIPVRLQGTQVVAEGPINGGGPLLRISGTGGTIFIKRQQ